MTDINDIKQNNETLFQKFAGIESLLGSFTDAKELLGDVLLQLEKEFDIPCVWISMINRPYMVKIVQAFMTSPILKERINIIDETTFLNLVPNGSKPVLANEDLKSFFKLMPKQKKFFVRSLAVAPFMLHQEIIGSLNLGDFSSLRYQPDMDTTLLQNLALSISSRLSEIIAPRKPDDMTVDEVGNAD